jgi:hypothetical protein
LYVSRATDAKAKPLSDEVAPDAAEARPRRRELHCQWREELRPTGMKEAGEDVMRRRRENCAVVGPTIEDSAGSQTPQFKYGVLEWSQLN